MEYLSNHSTGDYNFISGTGVCKDTVALHLTISNGLHIDTTATACGSFVWHGQTYTITGNYNFISGTGVCKDTVALHLTISNGLHIDTTATACGSFVWHGQTYTTTGDYNFITGTGVCKDTVTLHLTVTTGIHTDTTATACGSYTWHRNRQTYNATGVYNYITTSNGCPDTLELHLTITQGIHTDTTATACGLFTWNRNGQTYSATGVYNYIRTTNSCPDTLALHLTITQGIHADTTATACGSFTWNRNGQTYNATGVSNYITTTNGCPDTLALHLTITSGIHTDTTATECGSYTWNRNGQTYNTTGVYNYIITTNGCPDTLALHLTITSGIHTDTTATGCGSYTWNRNGQTYNTTGVYNYNITTNGCPDTLALHLTITQGIHTDTTATACGSFTWNGQTYATSGNYDFITGSGVCKDTVTLHLTIKTGIHTDTTATACGSYTWNRNGQTYSATGVYNYITTTNGCPDTIALHLTITSGIHTDTTATACGSYTWIRNNQTYNATGVYNYITTSNGCPDTIALHLTITQVIHTDTTATACGSYTWNRNGQTYNTTGVYNYITTTNGCPDTLALHLTITSGTAPTFTQIGPLCQNSTAPVLPATSTNNITGTWSSASINTSAVGTTTYTFTPSSGCATPATMDITVNAGVGSSFSQIGPLCQNSTAPALPATSNNNIAGTWIPATINTSAAGTTTYTFTPSSGCATPATMDITVNAGVGPSFTQIDPLCQNSTAPALPATSNNNITGTWSPATINTATTGTTTYTFTPSSGCATPVTMDIKVSAGTAPTFTQIGPLCQNSTAPLLPATSNNNITGTWSPATINTATTGTTTYTFTPSSGCATPATMDITVNAGVGPSFSQIGPLCQNSTAPALPATSNNNIIGTWSPAAINTSAPGTIKYTFTPTSGCAVPATMDITVTAGITPSVTIAASATTTCAGSSVIFTATPVNGGAAPAYQWQINGTDVPGANASVFTTTALKDKYVVTGVMTSNATCVTTPVAASNQITITVNPLPVMVITDPADVCAPATIDITAASVTAGSGAGLTYTYFTDAAATTPLSNPKTIAITGTYYIKGTTAAGCSIVSPVKVTINPLPNLVVTDPAAICAPGSIDITLPAITAGSDAGLTLSYYTDASATKVLNNPGAVTAGGTYYIKAVSAFGCVTIKPVRVVINPLPTAVISGGGALCRGDSKTLDIILTGVAPWTVTYSDGNTTITKNGITSSLYKLVVSPTVNTTYSLISVVDANCSNTSSGSAAVSVGTPIAPIRYTTINATANLPKQLQARIITSNDKYTWTPAPGLDNPFINNPVATIKQTTDYLIKIDALTGCSVVDSLLVNIYPASGPPAIVSTIFVPKAFSPNRDGHNDKLTPLLFRIKDLYYFRVFNRWGQLVYETNIKGEGWDGTFKGVPLGADVFTWTAAGVGEDGRTHNVRGQSVLLR